MYQLMIKANMYEKNEINYSLLIIHFNFYYLINFYYYLKIQGVNNYGAATIVTIAILPIKKDDGRISPKKIN